MNRTPCRGILTAIALATCAYLALALESYAADEPAGWAPQDAVLYVGVANCDEFVAAAKKTSTWQMLHDPALKGTVEPWTEFATKLQELMSGKLGLDSPKQLEVYPHGGLVLFAVLSPPGGAEGKENAHLGVVMEMGESLEAMQRLTRAVVEKALENKARRDTKEVAGTEITTIRFGSSAPADEADKAPSADNSALDEIHELIEELPMDDFSKMALHDALVELEPPEEFAFAFADSKFVLASDTETAVQTVRQLKKGKEGSFATTSAMGVLRRQCDLKAQVQVVVNLPIILDLASKKDPETAKVVRGMGLNALGPVVLTYEVAPGKGVDTRVRGFLQIKGERTGVAKLLMMANTKTAPAASIGAEAAIYGSVNLSPAEILAEVLQIASRVDPEAGEQMRASLKVPQPDGSMLDIQKDVVDHLSGPLFGMMTLAPPYDADHVNAMLALGHSSRAAIEKLLALVPPGMVMPREMMGSVIYESPMIPIQGLAAALTERVLIIPGTKGAIESYIRAEGRQDGGLADDSDFKRIARLMPKQSCAVLYTNGRAVFEAQLAIDKAGDVPEEPPMFAPAGTLLRAGLVQDFVGKGVPDAESLRKYLTVAMLTLSSETDGLRLEALSLLPPPKDASAPR